MPPTVSYSNSTYGGTSGVCTLSVTIPAGSGQTLVVFPFCVDAADRLVDTVTANGSGMTMRGFIGHGISAVLAGAYTLENPTAGTYDIVVTLNQLTGNMGMHVVVVDGGGGYSAYAAAGNASTVNVSSATDGLVLGFGGQYGATSITNGAGQTTIQTLNLGGVIGSRTSSEDGAATVTTSYTFSGGTATTESVVAAAIAPAAGGSSIAAISSGYHTRSLNR